MRNKSKGLGESELGGLEEFSQMKLQKLSTTEWRERLLEDQDPVGTLGE